MNNPTLVYHADWGSKPSKRWCATATLGTDGRYTASGPSPVGEPTKLIENLKSAVGGTGIVFAGFDFPIGVPAHFAERAGIVRFREFLPNLGLGVWKEFCTVCEKSDQITLHRPFYPYRSKKGCVPQHLFDAHEAKSMLDLLRKCERGGNGQRQACSLFWTMGGNQVGKAAIIGWRDVLAPGLNDDSIRLWPFDGKLEFLFKPGYAVIAETYPAECYGWFPGEPLGSKTDVLSRRKFGTNLLRWAQMNHVNIDAILENVIVDGFPEGRDDAFDAVVGLFGMLQISLGLRDTHEPQDKIVRDVEGWILGR